MEIMFAAAAIASPIGLIIFLLIPITTISLARGPDFSAGRLVSGYVGALCALAVVVAAMSYVSPEDSASVYQVPPDRYWSVLIGEFIGTFIVAAFATVIGISIVGIPMLLWLSRNGNATAPWLILSAVAISAAVSIFLYGLMHSSSNITLLGTFFLLVSTHVISAFGFSLAARLPWTFRLNS